MNDSLRLEPLHDIARCASIDDARSVLLSLCISKRVRVCFPVPPGHVVANYELALVDRRANFPGARPVVRYLGRARVEHQIRWIVIDFLGLKQILDAGSVVLEQHFNGGLADHQKGLSFRPLECCVIRRDSPVFLPSEFEPKPELLTEGVVFPIKQEVRFNDLFVSRKDGDELREAIQSSDIVDKWRHKTSAPHVYRLYAISQRVHDMEEVVTRLMEGDEAGVFTKAIAKSAARILKIDVGEHAVAQMKFEAIRDNEIKKDYSDPSISKRMSLVLLATDCWLHDQALNAELEKMLESKRLAFKLAQEGPTSELKLKTMKSDLDATTIKARRELLPRLYMPSGLREYLKALGFSGNLAGELERIIKGESVGGVHARTRRSVASDTKSRATKRGWS